MIEIIYPGYCTSNHYFDAVNSFADIVASIRATQPALPVIVRSLGMTVVVLNNTIIREER